MGEELNKSLAEMEAAADKLNQSSTVQSTEDNVSKGVEAGDVSKEANKPGESTDKKDENKEPEKKEAEKKDDSTQKSVADETDLNKGEETLNEISAKLETFEESLSKSNQSHDRFQQLLAKSMGAMLRSQNESLEVQKSMAAKVSEQETLITTQAELIKSLEGRLEGVEKQPVGRKAAVNVVEKSFNDSVGSNDLKGEQLSKSELLGKMEASLLKGEPGITPNDMVHFERTGMMSDSVKAIIGA